MVSKMKKGEIASELKESNHIVKKNYPLHGVSGGKKERDSSPVLWCNLEKTPTKVVNKAVLNHVLSKILSCSCY